MGQVEHGISTALNNNQKEFIIQGKVGLNQLASMEPEMFLPSTIFGHVA